MTINFAALGQRQNEAAARIANRQQRRDLLGAAAAGMQGRGAINPAARTAANVRVMGEASSRAADRLERARAADDQARNQAMAQLAGTGINMASSLLSMGIGGVGKLGGAVGSAAQGAVAPTTPTQVPATKPFGESQGFVGNAVGALLAPLNQETPAPTPPQQAPAPVHMPAYPQQAVPQTPPYQLQQQQPQQRLMASAYPYYRPFYG